MTSSEPPKRTGRVLARFFGGLLMAIGGLLAVSSGLCTLAFIGASAWPNSGMGMAMAPIALLFGAVPMATGAGIFFAGPSTEAGPT